MKKDLTPWLLLPGIALALSSVTLLAPHGAAQAAPPVPVQPAPQAAADSKTAADDDDDRNELLEHWDNPPYTREARWQMAGISGSFLVLGAAACRRQLRRRPLGQVVPLARETDFLKPGAASPSDTRPNETRKAA